MSVVFPPIFVTDTKIIYDYNFVAPLTVGLYDISCPGCEKVQRTLKNFKANLN